jgi:malate permease and related proteins
LSLFFSHLFKQTHFMSLYLTILCAALPVFVVLGMGYFSRVRGWLLPGADDSVMKLVVNALYPFLILTFILGNPALKDPANIALGMGIGAFIIVFGIGISYIVAPLGGMRIGSGRRTFAFSTGIHNYAYIAIPVAGAVFGVDSPAMGVLIVCNVGIEAMLWTYGIMVLTGSAKHEVLKKILNPTVIALIVGLSLNFCGVPDLGGAFGRVYGVALAALGMMGACAIPLGLFISGATFCDLVRNGEWLGRWQIPVFGVILRNGLLPAFFILMACTIPFPRELKQVLAVHAAMPAAMFPIVLSRFYGGNTAVAVQVVIVSTAAGLLTIPFWLATGLHFIG